MKLPLTLGKDFGRIAPPAPAGAGAAHDVRLREDADGRVGMRLREAVPDRVRPRARLREDDAGAIDARLPGRYRLEDRARRAVAARGRRLCRPRGGAGGG